MKFVGGIPEKENLKDVPFFENFSDNFVKPEISAKSDTVFNGISKG